MPFLQIYVLPSAGLKRTQLRSIQLKGAVDSGISPVHFQILMRVGWPLGGIKEPQGAHPAQCGGQEGSTQGMAQGVEGQAGDVSRPQECLRERALEKYGKRGLGGGRE